MVRRSALREQVGTSPDRICRSTSMARHSVCTRRSRSASGTPGRHGYALVRSHRPIHGFASCSASDECTIRHSATDGPASVVSMVPSAPRAARSPGTLPAFRVCRRQRILVVTDDRLVSLRRPRLPQDAAGAPLRYRVLLPHVLQNRLRRSGLTSFPPQPLSISLVQRQLGDRNRAFSASRSFRRRLPAIFLAPAVVRLFRYPDPPAHFSRSRSFPQMVDYLFNCKTFSLCSLRDGSSRISNSAYGPG